MGIQILSRGIINDNPFRRALGQLMQFPGEELILATGYATEALLEPHNYTDFVDKINCGFQSAINPKIIIIGGMFEKRYRDLQTNQWVTTTDTAKFQDFINGLRKSIDKKIVIDVYRAKMDKWHSKIAIKRRSRLEPVAAIVGSSNLTNPAFSVQWSGFNHEADVFIYSKGNRGIRNLTYCSKDLIDDKNSLLGEFISALRERGFRPDSGRIHQLCESVDGTVQLQDYTMKNFPVETEEDLQVLDLVCMIKECNRLMEAAGNEKTVNGNSVISVRAYTIAEDQILTDINRKLNDALSLYTQIKANCIL